MKYLVLLIAIITFTACQPKPIDIEVEQAPPKLVIYSQVIPNSVMLIYVSKSFGALDYSENDKADTSRNALLDRIMVKNANVSISYNGITDELKAIPEIPGLYASITIPQFINTEYKLSVIDPETALSIKSKSTMLKQIPFDEVSAKVGEGEDSINTIVSVKFTDPADEINWYMINIYGNNKENDDPNNIFMKSTGNNVIALLDDQGFNGEQFIGEQIMYQWVSDTVFASISNISQQYYDYLVLHKKGGSAINQIFAEPINYPTNIEGGYGFFNTHYPDPRIIIVEK